MYVSKSDQQGSYDGYGKKKKKKRVKKKVNLII